MCDYVNKKALQPAAHLMLKKSPEFTEKRWPAEAGDQKVMCHNPVIHVSVSSTQGNRSRLSSNCNFTPVEVSNAPSSMCVPSSQLMYF